MDRFYRQCRACGALIHFARTTKGKPIPIDAAPDLARGNVEVCEHGTALVLSGADLDAARAAGAVLYLSHFATCPKAATFRKPKAKGEAGGRASPTREDGARAGNVPSVPPPEP